MRILLLVTAALIVASAQAQTASPTLGCAPLEVDFAAPIDDPGPFLWTFGNGATATEAQPSTVFTEPGTFAVELRRGAGGAVIGTIDVQVFPPPTIDVIADPAEGCAPLEVQLRAEVDLDPAIAIQTYRFALGDGGTEVGNPVTNTYDSLGAYEVAVELRTNLQSCNATATFDSAVVVTDAPSVEFAIAPDPAIRCEAPGTFQLRNLSSGIGPLDYVWTFGNGDSSAVEQPGGITYPAEGDYVVALTATDSTGCARTFEERVTVGSPTADFDLPDTVCLGATYDVTALGAGEAFDFTFGPGITVLADDGATAEVTFDQPGEVTVSLVVTAAGCSGDTTRTLFVQGLDLAATSTPDESCTKAFGIQYTLEAPEGAEVAWRFDYDTTTADMRAVTKVYAYDENGPFGYNDRQIVTASATVTTTAGCVFDTTLTDFVDVPNALYVPSTLRGCAPLEVTFFDSTRTGGRTVDTYTFDWGDGQVEEVTGPGPWTHTYADPGEYFPTLAVVLEGGCGDTSLAYRITAGELLGGEVSFTADVGDACPGEVLTFTNTTPRDRDLRVHFAVEGGDAAFCGSDDVYEHVVTQPIDGPDINLRLFVDDRGCVDSSTTAAYPYSGAPIARLDYRSDCETPFEVTLFDSTYLGGGAQQLEVFGVGATAGFRQNTTIAALDSLVVTLPSRGTYRAVLTAEGTGAAAVCGPSRDTVEFYVTEPVASFDIDELLCANQPLDLDAGTSQDVNATCGIGYQWDFSFTRPYVTDEAAHMDVTGPALDDPQSISLIVDDIKGCRDTLTRTVRFFSVTPVATPLPDRICLPSTVEFDLVTVADTTIDTYSWSFGGVGTSDVPAPTFTFEPDPSLGTLIPVTVSVTDVLGCPGEETIFVEVYRPESVITTDPLPQICQGESIEFSASDFTEEGSRLLFEYDFGNGETGSSQRQRITYDSAGAYAVTLDYIEEATGCRGTTGLTVDVQSAPQVAFSTDVDGESPICFPRLVTFTDESTSDGPYTPIWLAGNVSGSGSTFASALERGTTEVTLIGVTSGGCADTTSRELTLVGAEGDFDVPDLLCVGEEVEFALRDTANVGSFTWDFGNGTTLSDQDPARVTYDELSPDGTRVVSLTLRSTSGECDFAVTDTIDFLQVIADFVVDEGGLAACDTEVSFEERGTQGEAFRYDFAGLGTSDEADPTFDFPAEGTYDVTLTASLADGTCRDTVTQAVEVLGPLEIDVQVETACRGEAVELFVDANREVERVVVDPFGLADVGRGGRFLAGPVNDDVTVAVTAFDAAGCETTVEDLAVRVVDAFEGVGDTSVIVRGGAVAIDLDDAPDGLVYRWQDPAATGCADCPSPTVSPEETTRYILEVTDANGCSSAAIVFTVVVLDAPIVPNLFTPNGDGRNDDWGPLLPEGAQPTVQTYRVYSRWGAVVFEGDDILERWTGETTGGEEAPSDVYAYVIELVYPGGQEFTVNGEVTLMR